MESQDNNTKIVEMVKYLYSQFLDNEKHVEHLHEMFMCFVGSDAREDDFKFGIITTYESLRQFLRESEALLKPKN